MTTLSPALMCLPRISTSRVAVRRKCMVTVAHRKISSTARSMTAGSLPIESRSSASWSGCSMSAFMPAVIV